MTEKQLSSKICCICCFHYRDLSHSLCNIWVPILLNINTICVYIISTLIRSITSDILPCHTIIILIKQMELQGDEADIQVFNTASFYFFFNAHEHHCHRKQLSQSRQQITSTRSSTVQFCQGPSNQNIIQHSTTKTTLNEKWDCWSHCSSETQLEPAI